MMSGHGGKKEINDITCQPEQGLLRGNQRKEEGKKAAL